jgi:hypothetical protein
MPSRPHDSRNEFGSAVTTALMGGLVLACLAAWASGQLAGLLFTHTWLRLEFADLPWITYGWARNWWDPAMAWPAGARGLLPGPVGMYLCLGLVLAAPLTLVHRIRRGARRPGSGWLAWTRPARSGPAGWASRW